MISSVFVFVEFFVMLIIFIILWYLTRPKDFKKTSLKKASLVVFSSFLMPMPLWIWNAIAYFGGTSVYEFSITNWDFIYLYKFLFYAVSIGTALVIFSYVITNIKSIYKFVLYALIFLFLLIPYILFFDFVDWKYYNNLVHVSAYFIVYGVSYLIVFLSLLLLTKTKYIEQ